MLVRLQDKHNKSSKAISTILASLSHLDLTSQISYDSAVMKAHGGFCDVFVGKASLPTTNAGIFHLRRKRQVKVAIKRLRVHIQSERDFAKLFVRELHVWSKLAHENILPLLGYVLEGEYPSVVSEWVENGTVTNYLRRNTFADLKKLILGIAAGMDYLHDQDIVHSDLKADNVLVGPSGEHLICDFGISRTLASSLSIDATTISDVRGSVRWMAVELLDIDFDALHTKETDVWAFGMTVYEILSKKLPYAHLKSDPRVMLAIIQGELPSRPPDLDDASPCQLAAWQVCEASWISPPWERITIKGVMSTLIEQVAQSI